MRYLQEERYRGYTIQFVRYDEEHFVEAEAGPFLEDGLTKESAFDKMKRTIDEHYKKHHLD